MRDSACGGSADSIVGGTMRRRGAAPGRHSRPREVGVRHHLYERVEADFRRPSEGAIGFGRVGEQQVDLGRPDELWVDADVAFGIEPGAGEG